ncbi:hypothetical protein SEVIR_9G146801v4 [Setaria viridis]
MLACLFDHAINKHMRSAQVHVQSGAEDDVVVGSAGASVGARRVVLGVAVGVRALPLEEPRVVGGPAGVLLRPRAAVLVRLEHRARVVAAAGGAQLGGALRRDVGAAPRPALGAPGAAARRQEVHGHVEPVHQRDVEEVEVLELVQPVLGQRVGRLPVPGALQHAAAVAGVAPPVPAAVEGAPRARPHATAGGARRHVDGPGLPVVQLPAAAHTVYWQLLVTVKVAASAAAAARRTRGRRWRMEAISLLRPRSV